jgi:hypothetical protein
MGVRYLAAGVIVGSVILVRSSTAPLNGESDSLIPFIPNGLLV